MVRSITIEHGSRRALLALGALALALVFLFSALLALIMLTPTAALALLGAALVSGMAGVAAVALGHRARPAARRPSAAEFAAGGPETVLVGADGAVYSARVVALPGASEHTMLLTARGYVLADGEGRVMYEL